MNRCLSFFTISLCALVFAACNYVTYTPRSKKNIQREKPSVVICNHIVDFRVEQNAWPVSKSDFISKGKNIMKRLNIFPIAILFLK